MTEYSRTDAAPGMPRWSVLVLATAATLLAIGVLWSAAPSQCGLGDIDPASLPALCQGGTTPALVTAGLLLAMLAALVVIAFTLERRRGLVALILGGVMLVTFVVGLMATISAASVGWMVTA